MTSLNPAIQPIALSSPAGASDGGDQALVARVANREPAALEEFIALHQPRVARLALRLCGWNRHDAQDIVQDVFYSAWRSAAGFRGDASVATWLAQITINRCRSYRRRQMLKRALLRGFTLNAARREISRNVDCETAQRVREAVNRLPAAQREAVVLYYLEQLSAAETARVLGISTGAVDVRLHRARKHLKIMLQDLSDERPGSRTSPATGGID